MRDCVCCVLAIGSMKEHEKIHHDGEGAVGGGGGGEGS